MNAFKLFQLLALAALLFAVACSNGGKKQDTENQQATNQVPAPPPEPQTPEDFVRQAFLNYQQGVMESNPILVLRHSDQNTLAYYDQMLSRTINGTETEIRGLSYPEKVIVLGTRTLESPQNIRAMDSNTFFQFITHYGLLEKGLMGRLSFGEVKIDEATGAAQAQVLLDGEPEENLQISLTKADDVWQMDLTPLIAYTNQTMTDRVLSTTDDPDGRLMQMVKAMSLDGQVPEGIWGPIK